MNKLIFEKHEGIMAQAEIEPIVSLELFMKRVESLKSFTNMEATVTPPNLLLGSAWEALNLHLESRNLKELKISEEGKDDSTIKSGLNGLMDMLARKVSPVEIKRLSLAHLWPTRPCCSQPPSRRRKEVGGQGHVQAEAQEG